MSKTLHILLCGLFIGVLSQGQMASTNSERSSKVELGVGLYSLIPDNLPNFGTRVFSVGPWIGIPLGRFTIQLEGLYGDADLFSLYLGDLSLRLNMYTPFLRCFIMAGGHILYYEPVGTDQTYYGANTGFGAILNFDKRVSAVLSLKVYFQEQNLIRLGASVVYLL